MNEISRIKTTLLFIAAIILINTSSAQLLDTDLIRLMDKAKEKNRAIKINDLNSEQARIDGKIALNTFLPKLTINGSYTRLNDDLTFDDDTQKLLLGTQKLLIKEAMGIPFNVALPEGVSTTEIEPLLGKDVLKTSLDLDWVLFSGFKVSNAVKASKHKGKSFFYANQIETNKLELKLIDTYDNLSLTIASEEVLNSTERYLNEEEKFINSAIKNGLATPIDRRKILLAKHKIEIKRAEIHNNRELLLALLHQITDEDNTVLKQLEPRLRPLGINPSMENLQRGEIKALGEAVIATEYQEKMERSHFIPKIALKGHYELLKDDLSLFDPDWYVGIGIKWNVFDGNIARNKAKKIQAERMKYEEQILETEELIKLSETKAKLALELANENIVMTQEEVVLASNVYDMVNKQYRNGLSTITELLDALNEVERAKFDLQQSYYKQRKAGFELLHAKGQLTSLL